MSPPVATSVKGRGNIPIVLCCAEEDEAALAKVVDELRREGMSPELVAGVEFDGAALTNAVDNAPAATLFVLCQSAALERAAVRRLAGLFSARGGPGQRVVIAAFTPSRPLAILPAIRTALKEMRFAEPVGDGRETSSHLRDVVEALAESNPRMPVASSTRPRGDAEALARELALGLAEAEAILERRADHADATPRQRSFANDAGRTRPASATRARGRETAAPGQAGSESATESHGVTTDPDESVRIPRSPAPVVADGATLAHEPLGNRWLLAFAVLGVAGLVALALMQVNSEVSDVAPMVDPRGAQPIAAAGHSEDPPRKGVRPAKIADTKPDAVPKSDRKAQVPPDDSADDSPEGPEVDPDEKATPTNSEKTPPAPPKTMSKRDAETAALLLAAAEGKVWRVGRMFVARGGKDSVAWDDAARVCRSHKVAGVTGFRLPSRNELRRIKAAGLLGAGTYWSRNKGSADDDAFAIDGATGAENLYLLVEPNGRATCVHE